MTTTPPQPCCLPNEIITNDAGLSWTIETTHHINCPNRTPNHDGTLHADQSQENH